MTAVGTRARRPAAARHRATSPTSPRSSARSSTRAPARSSTDAGSRRSTRAPSGSTRSRTAARSLPQETTGPRLRVLPQRRVSGRALLGLSAALFFVVLAGAVTIQAQRIQAQHDIDQLDSALLEADELHRVLRAEAAVAASPERVMRAAEELGMVEPGPVLPLVAPIEAAPASPASPDQVPADAPVEGDVAAGLDPAGQSGADPTGEKARADGG
jgi:hypothetical protein